MSATVERVHVVVSGLQVRSEMNAHGHWRATNARRREQIDATLLDLRRLVPERTRAALSRAPALRVRLTRLYAGRARAFDTDNLAGAFKFIRDAVARWLDRDDGPAAGIEWVTEQVRTGETGVRIEIEAAGA